MSRRTLTFGETSSLQRAAASAPPLQLAEERQLARAAHSGDIKAFERLVSAHLRLVFAIANDYRRFGAPMEELISEGVLGLVAAARRFDPERGSRLASYAAHWIRAFLRKYTLRNRRMVGPPSSRHGRALLANMARAESALAQQLGAAPDADLLAQTLGVSRVDVDDVRQALRERDVPVDDDGSTSGSVAVRSRELSPEALVGRYEQARHAKALLSHAFGTLAFREREIIRARRLCEDDDAPSFNKLGAGLGISRERVRQLEARGLRKLRNVVSGLVA